MTQQVGTPAYMAPEMAGVGGSNDGDDDESAMSPVIGKPVDVYSYGILLWTLWTQKLPYADLRVKNPFQLMVKVTSGYRPSIPPEMPVLLQGLMQKCWSGDPSSRPTFADIIEEIRESQKAEGLYRSGGGGVRSQLGSWSSGKGQGSIQTPDDHYLVSPNVRGREGDKSPPPILIAPKRDGDKKKREMESVVGGEDVNDKIRADTD